MIENNNNNNSISINIINKINDNNKSIRLENTESKNVLTKDDKVIPNNFSLTWLNKPWFHIITHEFV